jgi:hypothetical protein
VQVVPVDIRQPATVSFLLADYFEEGDRHQPSCARDQRVTRFVPVRIVLPADDMKEIPFAEAQFLPVARVWRVIIQRFDYLNQRGASGGSAQGVENRRWAQSSRTGDILPFSAAVLQWQIWE